MNWPWTTTNLWFQQWRVNITKARTTGSSAYCRAAAIANAQYVTSLALELTEKR